jgi:hypothetical protein
MVRLQSASLLVAASLVLGGSVGSAPSRAASTAIACPGSAQTAAACCGPLPAARDAAGACCGPIAAAQQSCCPTAAADIEPICCPASTQCATQLTIAASPNPVTAGQQVVISGTLTGGAAGTLVTLYQQLPGGGVFTQGAAAATDASGGYTIVQGSVDTNRWWYVAAGSQDSATVAESVYAVVTLNRVSVTTAKRRTVVLRGRVTPAHPGQRLAIEQLQRRRWRMIARPKLGNGSAYSVAITFAGHGVMRLRAVLAADRRNLRSLSQVISVNV